MIMNSSMLDMFGAHESFPAARNELIQKLGAMLLRLPSFTPFVSVTFQFSELKDPIVIYRDNRTEGLTRNWKQQVEWAREVMADTSNRTRDETREAVTILEQEKTFVSWGLTTK